MTGKLDSHIGERVGLGEGGNAGLLRGEYLIVNCLNQSGAIKPNSLPPAFSLGLDLFPDSLDCCSRPRS